VLLQVAFSRLDTRHEGMLERDEVRTGLKQLGVKLSSQELEALVERMDFDKNGKIGNGHPLIPSTVKLKGKEHPT